MKVPYYIGDPEKDPILENYPYREPAQTFLNPNKTPQTQAPAHPCVVGPMESWVKMKMQGISWALLVGFDTKGG